MEPAVLPAGMITIQQITRPTQARRLCLVMGWLRRLDGNRDWRSRLEETDRSSSILRRTVGIETEIIESTPANRICVWVLRKRLAAPSQRTAYYCRCPGGAAVSCVSHGSIVWPSRLLGRRMKSYVSNASRTGSRTIESRDRGSRYRSRTHNAKFEGIGLSLYSQQMRCHRFPDRARSD